MNNILKKLARVSVAYLSYYSGLNTLRKYYSKIILGPGLTLLCYHRVNDLPSDNSIYTVTPAQFDAQIKYIKNRFKVITFSDALKMKMNEVNPTDAAIITFDDGYKDNFTNAVPILEKHGVKACFFLTTDLIGKTGFSSATCKDSWKFPGMSWNDVRNLRDRGFELGAHTCSHPNLLKIPIKKAHKEIVESKFKIEQSIGNHVQYFAYPIGKDFISYNEAIKYIVAEYFNVCCTTTRGRNSFRSIDMLELHRICVQKWWNQFYFERELEGTFDFVGNKKFGIVFNK